MKELSIEQKAQRYDEALQRTRRWYDSNTNEGYRAIFEEIFPELKESEDESIRKGLIKFVSAVMRGNDDAELSGVLAKDCLAWLEKQGESDETKAKMFLINKGYPIDTNGTFPIYEEMYDIIKEGLEKQGEQKPVIEMKTPEESLGIDSNTYNKIVDECIYGEQKPADVEEISFFEDFRKTDSEVEPKFKVEKDKWYVCISQYCNCIEGRNYKASLDGRIIDDYGTEYDMHDDAYRWFRPWTIQDAKDGDVLEFGDHGRLVVGIVSYVNKTTGKVDVNCLLENNDFKVGNYYNLDTIKPHPVTKEQHDTLMKAMTDAGYTFDFEKKELKKIKQSPVDVITTGYCHVKDVEQNSAWSEKDDEIIEEIINDIECARAINYHAPKEGYEFRENWLESIKDRVQPQPNQEWSGEDEGYYDAIIAKLEVTQEDALLTDNEMDFLKSLEKRVFPKSNWNEEDITRLKSAITLLQNPLIACDEVNDGVRIKTVDWLKFLEERYTWKPSDEQMTQLKKYCPDNRPLTLLYEQLKKLINEK